MKRIISLILCFVMLLSFALLTFTACGDEEGEGAPSGDNNDMGNVGDGDGGEPENPPEPPHVHIDADDDLACDGCSEPYDDLEDFEVDGLAYKVNEDGVSCTVRSLGRAVKNRRYIIPAEIDGYAVTDIAEYAFRYSTELVEVVIPEGVKSIGDCAFYSCPNLKSVIISDTVEYIGKSAFEYCMAIRYVKLGDGLKTLDDRVFYSCIELIWVDWGKSLEHIGEYAFSNCRQLLSFTMAEPLITVETGAFEYCQKLFEIIDHSTMMSASVGDGYLGKNLIEVHEGETKFVLDGDFIFLKAEDKNYLCAYVGTDKELVLPESFRGEEYVIAKKAFFRNLTIESAKIDGVTAISEQAFAECLNLCFVEIGDAVKTVGVAAFADCSRLIFAKLGAGVELLDRNAFSLCTKLVEVVDNSASGVASAEGDNSGIGSYRAEIHSGESRMKRVDDFVFYISADGERLLVDYLGYERRVALPESFEGEGYSIGYKAFEGNKTLLTVDFSEGVLAIREEAFKNATALVYIKLSRSVKTIEKNAFYCCTNLVRFDVGAGVETIEDGAFTGCAKLIEVNNYSSLQMSLNSTTTFGGITKSARELNRFFNSTIVLVGDYIFYLPDGNKTPYVIGYVGEGGVMSLPEKDPEDSNLIVYYSKTFAQNSNYYAIVITQMPYQLGSGVFYQSNNMNKVFLAGSEYQSPEYQKEDLLKKCGYENPQIKGAVIYLYSEEKPAEDGYYWYYDEEGNIVYW